MQKNGLYSRKNDSQIVQDSENTICAERLKDWCVFIQRRCLRKGVSLLVGRYCKEKDTTSQHVH